VPAQLQLSVKKSKAPMIELPLLFVILTMRKRATRDLNNSRPTATNSFNSLVLLWSNKSTRSSKMTHQLPWFRLLRLSLVFFVTMAKLSQSMLNFSWLTMLNSSQRWPSTSLPLSAWILQSIRWTSSPPWEVNSNLSSKQTVSHSTWVLSHPLSNGVSTIARLPRLISSLSSSRRK